jgi:hypothetical protein
LQPARNNRLRLRIKNALAKDLIVNGFHENMMSYFSRLKLINKISEKE